MKRYLTILLSYFMGHRAGAAIEALAELNAARARHGLSPFIKDDLLTQGAMAVAAWRAEHLIQGHTPNDFRFLPDGAVAKSAGCGALEDSWGWGTCCTYDHWTYAGAAWARGRDNLRYMHVYVS